MFYLFLHLIALIYASATWAGVCEYYPISSLIIWAILSILILKIWLPRYINYYIATKEIPEFLPTQNKFQWGITAWIIILQMFANPIKLIYPNYQENFEQFLPMLVSAILYYLLTQQSMGQFRRLILPILPPEQTEAEFLRARLTNFMLAIPPILLWMLIEDTSKSGLSILYEIKIIIIAPIFFILLFLLAPKLFNWAWETRENADIELRDSILLLAQKTNTQISGVKIWNTFGEPLANAAVAGLLKQFRYVYVTEYLLESLSKEQINSVVAHELGHLQLGHVFTYTIFSILVLLLGLNYRLTMYLFFSEINLNGFLPSLIEGSLFIILFIWLFTSLSRLSEHQADLFSSIVAGKNEFISVIEYLSNTCEESTKIIPKWLNIHPTNRSRIKKIQENSQEKTEILLHQARGIRYAMLVVCIVLITTAVHPFKHVLKISELYEAKQAGNKQLTTELANSLPDRLKRHPEVLEILHHTVSPEVTLDL